MKKRILAVAVASAVSAPVLAQNVSVYGVLDLSYQSNNNIAQSQSATDSRGYTCSATAIMNRTTVGSNHWATSRIGLKGTEDLGGGLKAAFNYEGGASPDLGDAGELGNRVASVTVSGAFGSVSLGKVSADINSIQAGQGVGNFANIGSGTAQRPVNSVDFVTPSFNGFSGRVTWSPNASATESTSDASKSNGEYTSIGVKGSIGAFTFIAAQVSQDVKSSRVGGKGWVSNSALSAAASNTYYDTDLSATGNALDSLPTTASGGTAYSVVNWVTNPAMAQDGKVKDTALLVGYDFGVAKLTGQYLRTKSSGAVNNSKGINAETDTEVWATTLMVPMKGNMMPFINYRSIENKVEANKDSTFMAVGIDYALSKRTNAYVVHSSYDNNSGASAGGTQAGKNPSTTAIGVRHTF